MTNVPTARTVAEHESGDGVRSFVFVSSPLSSNPTAALWLVFSSTSGGLLWDFVTMTPKRRTGPVGVCDSPLWRYLCGLVVRFTMDEPNMNAVCPTRGGVEATDGESRKGHEIWRREARGGKSQVDDLYVYESRSHSHPSASARVTTD